MMPCRFAPSFSLLAIASFSVLILGADVLHALQSMLLNMHVRSCHILWPPFLGVMQAALGGAVPTSGMAALMTLSPGTPCTLRARQHQPLVL